MLINRQQIHTELCCQSLCHGDLSMTCMSVALIRPPIPKMKNIY